jgi:hypothetical protein
MLIIGSGIVYGVNLVETEVGGESGKGLSEPADVPARSAKPSKSGHKDKSAQAKRYVLLDSEI